MGSSGINAGTWGVIVCQIHRRIPQSRVASLFSKELLIKMSFGKPSIC